MPAPFKLRHVHAITGTLVLTVAGVLIVVLILAGRSQRWFAGSVALQIVLPESGAAGIRQGSEVYFLGTLVGTVSDVNLDSSGRMQARVGIRQDFFPFVRADSTAVVKRKFGVVGDAFFEITRGSGNPLPRKHASILCHKQLPTELENAIAEVRGEAVPALKKLNAGLDIWIGFGSNLVATRERLDQLLARADNLAADLQQGKGTAGKLLTDPAIAEEVQTLLAKANRSLDAVQLTLTNLQRASGNLDRAGTNLPAISDALNKEAKDLPGLVLQTQVSMRELERLIEAMQRTWLLRKHVNWTNPPPLRPSPPTQKPQKKPANELRSPKNSTP